MFSPHRRRISLFIQKLVAVLADPDFASVLHPRNPYPGTLVAALADHHQVGEVDRSFLRQNSSLDVLLRVGSGVLLLEIQAFHDCTGGIRKHFEHLAGLAAVLARQHENLVVLLDMQLWHGLSSSLTRR